MTMFDSRLNLSNQVVDEVDSFFKEKLFKTYIHRNVRLSEGSKLWKASTTLRCKFNRCKKLFKFNRGNSKTCQKVGWEKV